jgi:hypothetical protein
MARHYNFWADDAAVARLLARVESTDGVAIPFVRPSAGLVGVDPRTLVGARNESWWLALPQHLPLLRSRRLIDGTWDLERDGSPAIDLYLGPLTEEGRIRGWLWYLTSFYDHDDTRHHYPDDFLAWAGSLLGWARRNLERRHEP